VVEANGLHGHSAIIVVLHRALLFASIVPAIALVASCMGATEIVVHISTNACPSLQYTDIWVDGQHVTQAATPACDPTNALAVVDVGTITVLPSHGIDSDVDIALVGNVGGTCANPDTTEQQCIVARRAIAFNPHQRIDLPILIDNACAGFQCSGDQTCVDDTSGPHCVGSTCGQGDAPACIVDAGGVDAIVPDVIAFDVAPPPTCPVIFATTATPTFSWSFDMTTNDGQLHEDGNAFKQPLTSAAIISAPPTFCDNPYLRSMNMQALATSDNPLFQKFVTKSFIVGFAFDASSSNATLVSLAGSSSEVAGFDVVLANGALAVSFSSAVVWTNPTFLKPSVWHRFAMEVTTISNSGGNDVTSLTPYMDGLPGQPVPTTRSYVPGAPITFTVGAIDVDDVTYYAK
jgi:hypothetical protein